METREKFATIAKNYKKAHLNCEKCGEPTTEIHHIVSLSQGGTNDEENLQALCDWCHKKAHAKDKSELTKIGIQRARQKPWTSLIKTSILLAKILEEELTTASEVIELINSGVATSKKSQTLTEKEVNYLTEVGREFNIDFVE